MFEKAPTLIFYLKKLRHLTGWWIPERETAVSQSCAKRFSQLHLGRKGSKMKQRNGTKGGLCNAMCIVHVNENRILTFLFDRIPSAWASLNSPMARLPQSSTPTLWFNKLYTIEAKTFSQNQIMSSFFQSWIKVLMNVSSHFDNFLELLLSTFATMCLWQPSFVWKTITTEFRYLSFE